MIAKIRTAGIRKRRVAKTMGRNMTGEGLIDRWIKELKSDSPAKEENERVLIEKLKEIFSSEFRLVKMLQVEAGHLPYSHLTEEALRVAKEKQNYLEMIKELLLALNGQIDESKIDSLVAEPNGEFSEILKLENELGERLVAYSNWAEDFGYHEQAKTLLKIKEDHDRHQETIEKLIMKINASL